MARGEDEPEEVVLERIVGRRGQIWVLGVPAATSASCARSSATPTSRTIRARPAISRADSIRQTASIVRLISREATVASGVGYAFASAWARNRASCSRSSGVSSAPKSSASNTGRISTSPSGVPSGFGMRLTHSIASSIDLTCHSQ